MSEGRPVCPSCGCPARFVSGTATVMATVQVDGSPGKIVRSQGFKTDGMFYECGGGHRWNVVSGEVGTPLWIDD